ncbi:hypothetical protein AMECASPLE_029262 [Ameca splendens]|uniref:Uncharacterized protein n=1 Tax=Ameca splendens TaxID=208324 RepID=A0ABV0ZEI9_9TELE
MPSSVGNLRLSALPRGTSTCGRNPQPSDCKTTSLLTEPQSTTAESTAESDCHPDPAPGVGGTLQTGSVSGESGEPRDIDDGGVVQLPINKASLLRKIQVRHVELKPDSGT